MREGGRGMARRRPSQVPEVPGGAGTGLPTADGAAAAGGNAAWQRETD